MNSYFKKKKILITGGLGFLGSNLAHRLLQEGAQITVLDCLLNNHGGNLFNIADIKNDISLVKGDIRNEPLVKKLIKNQEILFNIAAQTSHTDSVKNPLLDADINNRGQINILEACRNFNPSVKIVYCSTRAVYGGNSKKNINEKTLTDPLDIYAANKLAGEFYHKIYHKVFGLHTAILRIANGYGPRAQMKSPSFGILNWFIRLAIDNQEIKIFGDGKQIRDYVYVDDIVESFLKIASSKHFKGDIFNVGSGTGVSLIDIVKRIVRITGKGKIVHVPWPDKNKKIDVGDFIADIRKIRNQIGWKTAISLENGLIKTIAFYKDHKNHYWQS